MADSVPLSCSADKFNPLRPSWVLQSPRRVPESLLQTQHHTVRLGTGCDNGNGLVSSHHLLSRQFEGHHIALQHQARSAISTITSLPGLDHSGSRETLLRGLLWERGCCPKSPRCRCCSSMVHQLLSQGAVLCQQLLVGHTPAYSQAFGDGSLG